MSDANKKTKNVLMTTLSTLNGPERLNYYFCRTPNSDGACPSRLLSAKFTSEIGSKYLLSTIKLDKIVVIGSKETIKGTYEKDSDSFPPEFQKINLLNDLPSRNSSADSAYTFYLKQLRSFLMSESSANQTSSQDTPDVFTEQIGVRRIDELKTIVNRVREEFQNSSDCEGPSLQEVLHTSKEPDKTFRKLDEKLREEIKKDINDTHDLSTFENAYKERIRQLDEEYADVTNINIDRLYKDERKKITDDIELSSSEKHILFLLLKEKIAHMLTKQENYRFRVLSEEEKLNLLFEKSELEKELEMIKSNRLSKETDYAKYYIYTLLENEYKFFPLKENKEWDGPLVVFVDESTSNGEDNLHEITNAICENDEPVNLYIDMQGGNRTSGYVRNAVLSILTNQINAPVFIQKIIAINYGSKNWLNEIVDETKRYKILDLVSGMNAFIRYGKADIIKSYCDTVSVPKTSPFHKLVDLMVGIDHALCLCDVNTLYKHISALRKHFEKYSDCSKDNFSNIYQVLRGGIELDYGSLTTKENVEYIDLIDWSLKKGFTQQALTLIEDKMPSVFFEKKWLTRPADEELTEQQNKFLDEIGPRYSIKRDNLFLYYLPDKRKKRGRPLTIFHLWTFFKSVKKGRNREQGYPPKDNKLDWIRERLKNEHYTFDFPTIDDFRQTVKNTEKELQKCNNNTPFAEFIFLYCKIRSLTTLYYKLKEAYKPEEVPDYLNKYSPEQFFYTLEIEGNQDKRDFSCKDPDISFTVLGCIGTQQYKKNKDDTQEITFDIGLHPAFTCDRCTLNCNARIPSTVCTRISENCRRRMLEEFFLLHQALKSERNCNNHAVEQDERLPKEIVDNAIRIYIKRFKKLQDIIDSADTPS